MLSSGTTYQMDVKSAFLYGKIEEEDEDGEEVDVHMYRSMIGSLMYLTSSRPDIMFVVYVCVRYHVNPKVSYLHAVKMIFSARNKLWLQILQQKLNMWLLQVAMDKYSGFKINCLMMEVKNANTLIETQKPLLKDEDGEEVDVHMYRSMIGSLMYLTSSRPDIMFVVYACARYQVNPKVSYLQAVKMIFRAKTINGEGQLQAIVDGKKTKQYRKPRRKVTEVPQTSNPTSVADEAINEEMDDSLERAATTATSLDAKQDKAILESSKDEGLGEKDASKQGRIADINANEDITLVSIHDEQMFDADQDLGGEEVFVAQQDENVVEKEVDVAQVQVTTVATTPTISIDETVPRTPQQNGVVERRNRTLVEAAQTMLIFSKAPMFLWAEAVATASNILENFNQQLTLEYLLAMLQARKGIESTTKGPNVFDELTEPIAPVHLSTGPAPTFLTPGQISSGLVPNPVPATPYTPPTNKELEILFQPMFDEYLEPPRAERPGAPAQAVQVSVTSAGTPLSTTIDQDAPSLHISPSSLQSHSLPPGVVAEPHFMEDHNVAPIDNNPFVNVFAPEPHSKASSSGDISSTESPYVSQTLHHLNKRSKDHPLDNVIGNPFRPVSTRKQLATDA
nr:hypothetical protein [Tanacetum cinerariifolium]